ncbi:MAG: thiamine-phosphate kinase [Chloroflexaceae bacterium]|nr:thiamine-phosphate kinase [Chloroflexaceae bacterium]
MRVSELGEFPLIERLGKIVDIRRADVLVGIGDDAAVLADRGDELLLATIDSQVEGIHYLPYLMRPEQLGRRALVVNMSDIAAMGGHPQFALVSLALPAETEVEWVEACYRGMQAEAGRFGVLVVGGNVTRSRSGVSIDIAMLGRVRRDHLMLRSGARPGDVVLVTGQVGEALAGLHLVFDPRLPVEAAVREQLITRYLEPSARIPEAAVIARSGRATAMIDVSDGLSGDIGHICEQSQVGVRLWAKLLPVSPAARSVAEAMQVPFWKLAMEGGDDYGLCFTAPPGAAPDLCTAIAQETGTVVTVIGEVLPAEDGRHLVLPGGQDGPLDARGWQHFGRE